MNMSYFKGDHEDKLCLSPIWNNPRIRSSVITSVACLSRNIFMMYTPTNAFLPTGCSHHGCNKAMTGKPRAQRGYSGGSSSKVIGCQST